MKIASKISLSEASPEEVKLYDMLDKLDAKLISMNKDHILLSFPKDQKWIVYTNELKSNKNIPGRALIEINKLDAKAVEASELVRMMVK